jgi:AraC-like DNA-binding protein
LITDGFGAHSVDFVDYPVSANSLLLIKPGQIQQFCLNDSLAGMLVLVDPSFLLPDLEDKEEKTRFWWAPHVELTDEVAARFLAMSHNLSVDIKRFDGHPLRMPLMQHSVYALLLLLRIYAEKLSPRDSNGKAYRIVVRFKELIEQDRSAYHLVKRYADLLGCTEKTLHRACICVEGRTPKAMLTERVILEAKRLLAQGRRSIAEIAQDLGFSETSNFNRFFKKNQNVSPARFRDTHTRP